jgi:hypothetical protein
MLIRDQFEHDDKIKVVLSADWRINIPFAKLLVNQIVRLSRGVLEQV